MASGAGDQVHVVCSRQLPHLQEAAGQSGRTGCIGMPGVAQCIRVGVSAMLINGGAQAASGWCGQVIDLRGRDHASFGHNAVMPTSRQRQRPGEAHDTHPCGQQPGECAGPRPMQLHLGGQNATQPHRCRPLAAVVTRNVPTLPR